MIGILTALAALWILWQAVAPLFILGGVGALGGRTLIVFATDAGVLLLMSVAAFHALRRNPTARLLALAIICIVHPLIVRQVIQQLIADNVDRAVESMARIDGLGKEPERRDLVGVQLSPGKTRLDNESCRNATPERLGTGARVLPFFRDGKMLGYRLHEVDRTGPWPGLGFRENDVLTTINDFNLAHADGLAVILDMCSRPGREVRYLRPRD
jgi:hypothetical protein